MTAKHTKLYEGDWLEQQIRAGRTYRDISLEVGCTPENVLYAARWGKVDHLHHHSPGRPVEFPALRDANYLRKRIVDEGATYAWIAADIGCSLGSVKRAVSRAGISRTTSRE